MQACEVLKAKKFSDYAKKRLTQCLECCIFNSMIRTICEKGVKKW